MAETMLSATLDRDVDWDIVDPPDEPSDVDLEKAAAAGDSDGPDTVHADGATHGDTHGEHDGGEAGHALSHKSSHAAWDWATDPTNPYNWSTRRKWAQVAVISSVGFLTSVGTSILSPAVSTIKADFGLHSTTVALLPLSLYVFALAVGPVFLGGPLSETIGRLPIVVAGPPLGLLFCVGAALTPSFAGLCILRFLAGFVLSPILAIASGILTETFRPVERGVPVAIFIVTPFLGPGMGPVFGAFSMRKGWRWTQWTLVFFAAFSLLLSALFARETYHPVLRQRRMRALGIVRPDSASHAEAPLGARLRLLLTAGLLRPLHMMFTEPIVGLICLYIACEFATLFSFFAAVPYVFENFYAFSREEAGLVFLSIVVGCVLGLATIIVCDALLYRRQIPRFPPHQIPPEHRLYAAMIGSVGLPAGLFWFGWSADRHAHWAVPVVAIVPFAWGNICIFISLMQYLGDTYSGATVASAGSANSLARYALAAAFPLFTLQMYGNLGIGWASSLLGFIALVLLPVPWLFFRYGPAIRQRSRY